MEHLPVPRVLEFTSLDNVASEVHRLLETGYRRAGRWDLGQVCAHLADWMSYPMDGFPPAPVPVRWIFPLLRATVGRREFKRLLAGGSFRAGSPTLKSTVHEPGMDTRGAERLLATLEQLKAFRGEPRPSPLFGPMDRDSCVRLQLLHCAHHLGFLVTGPGEGGAV